MHAWHRFGSAIQLILANVFSIPYPCYVDDFFGADVQPEPEEQAFACATPAGAADIAHWVIEDLLGWELDTDKAVADAETARQAAWDDFQKVSSAIGVKPAPMVQSESATVAESFAQLTTFCGAFAKLGRLARFVQPPAETPSIAGVLRALGAIASVPYLCSRCDTR